jgi:ribonuclease T1
MRSIQPYLIVVAIVTLTAAFLASSLVLARDEGASAVGIKEVAVAALPREAQQTLQRIKRGGPYPYQRDGAVFGNYERRLPLHNRGYYREYTVPTPGTGHRGARRIVAATGGEYYYTDDHYRSFQRIKE